MTERLRTALAELSQAATALLESTPDYDALLATIARTAAKTLHAAASVTLFDDGGTTMTPVAFHDEDPVVAARFAAMLAQPRPVDMPLIAQIRDAGIVFQPSVDLDALAPQLAPEAAALFRELDVRGFILVMMRSSRGPIGTLTVMRHRKDVPALDDIDREVAQYIGGFAGLALENARLFRSAQSVDELRNSEARAQQATMFLDAIVENLPNMVFVKDADRLSFVRFNRAGEELLGFPRDALLGKNDYDFFPREEAEFFVAKDRETLANKQLVDIAEEPIQTATGQRWLHTKKVPIVDAKGVPRYLLGISEDITERKRDVAALRAAVVAAEAANKELESFSYSVAHDLRTPLRAIDGFSQALLEDYGDRLDDTGRGQLQRVRASAQRMATLIDDLLKLSRVTRAEIHRSRIDLGEMFRAALAQLQRMEPGRRVELVTSGDLIANADPKLLGIVLDNLCGNAWKFTSKTAEARIELGGTDGVFFIRDNGVGFDMTYADKLFGVFQRLHTESDFPGTGIGLATVQRILARHDGRIWAASRVGGGTTFYFTVGDRKGAS